MPATEVAIVYNPVERRCEECDRLTVVYWGFGKGHGPGWLCTSCLSVHVFDDEYEFICDKAGVPTACASAWRQVLMRVVSLFY